jgi:uncharacterized paraquat-inducible protein A
MAQSSQRRCPECDAEIPFEAINIQEGMASCNACENLFRISELNWSHLSREDVLAKTPWGCSLVHFQIGFRLPVAFSKASR